MAYAYAYQPHRTSAPVSLHVVAIFQYIGGILTLGVGALLALAALDIVPAWQYTSGADTWTTRPADITWVVGVVVAVFAVVGLIALVLGRKLQRGRNWARITLILLNILSLASALWQVYSVSGATSSALAGAVLPALFLLLLNTRAARSWCRHGTY